MDISGARALLNRRLDRPGRAFLELIARDGRAVAPGCHCAMDAAIVSKIVAEFAAKGLPCQFNCAYGSGWGASAMLRYKPDMGFHDRTEIIRIAQGLVEGAFPLPVVMDAETGFGPRLSVPEVIRAYAQVGVAVAHLEDQPQDRRCGHIGGKEVCELDDFLQKLSLALVTVDAMGSDMLIMARTDAWDAANGGQDEAVRRCKAFADLRIPGCPRKIDLIWCELPTPDPGPAREISQEMRRHDPTVRLAINFSPNMDQAAWFSKHPEISPATYEMYAEMGFVFQFHTVWSAKVQMQAMYDWTRKMAEKGSFALYEFQDQLRGHPTASGQSMSRTKEFQELEQLFGGDKTAERFAKSRGFGSTGESGIHDVDEVDAKSAK